MRSAWQIYYNRTLFWVFSFIDADETITFARAINQNWNGACWASMRERRGGTGCHHLLTGATQGEVQLSQDVDESLRRHVGLHTAVVCLGSSGSHSLRGKAGPGPNWPQSIRPIHSPLLFVCSCGGCSVFKPKPERATLIGLSNPHIADTRCSFRSVKAGEHHRVDNRVDTSCV